MLFSKPDKRKTDFLLRHPEMATNYICRNYPFNFEELKQYQYDVDWYHISLNHHVEWSYKLIDYFVDKLDFHCKTTDYFPGFFCLNHGLPWSIELIKRYEHLWDWNILMFNSKLYSNKEIYDYMKKVYREYTTDEHLKKASKKCDSLAGTDFDYYENNYDLEYSFTDLSTYFSSLHQNWAEVEADPNPDWEAICNNSALDWSLEKIEKYKNKINFRQLSFNIAVPWSAELLSKYMMYFIRDTYRSAEVKGDYEFMGILSMNRHFPWNLQTITQFEKIIDFNCLTCNPAVDWSIEILLKYENRWGMPHLYHNPNIMPKAFAEMQNKEVMKEMLEMIIKNHKKLNN